MNVRVLSCTFEVQSGYLIIVDNFCQFLIIDWDVKLNHQKKVGSYLEAPKKKHPRKVLLRRIQNFTGVIPKYLPVLLIRWILCNMAVDRITAFDQAIRLKDTSDICC